MSIRNQQFFLLVVWHLNSSRVKHYKRIFKSIWKKKKDIKKKTRRNACERWLQKIKYFIQIPKFEPLFCILGTVHTMGTCTLICKSGGNFNTLAKTIVCVWNAFHCVLSQFIITSNKPNGKTHPVHPYWASVPTIESMSLFFVARFIDV